ncbi:MAG: hypothetical protein PHN78_05230 [Dehalococcoidales bacterium]|nr:hypothetical protein [Dehalococcoidales bacterium]
MIKLKTSLRRIIGRLKKKMADYLLTVASIMLPLSMVFLLLSLDKEGVASWGFFIFGVSGSILGVYYMLKAWDALKKKEDEDRKSNKELIEEIRGFREDFNKRGKNERNNTNKGNM